MKSQYLLYLAGKWLDNGISTDVVNPYDGRAWTKTWLATKEHIEEAIQKGLAVEEEMKHLPTHVKADALMHIAKRLAERREEFARAMSLETAKPLLYSRIEVDRAVQTFIDGAEECKRIYGEWFPLDRTPAGNGHEATVRRFPVGLVAGIAPFNFPLNLVAHKIAPAIASGCPIVLKPATKTPISALLLAELIDETNLPKGAVSILPADRDVGDMMVTDPRFKLLTFTGSPGVGWDMKARCGKKKIVLELGGNAALIVAQSADVSVAVEKSVVGSFSFSGQSCIHTQRIYVHESLFENFKQQFVEQTKNLVYGDPLDEKTQVSAMIDGRNAERIDTWVKEAVTGGAQVLIGGERIGDAGYEPTVLTDTTSNMTICAEEAFAPVVILESYVDFKEVIMRVNDSKFGLQTGVFTNALDEMNYAFDALDVGGVIINNVPGFRADHMPYGGVKDSGLGREGVRYAIEDMTERKVLVINKG